MNSDVKRNVFTDLANMPDYPRGQFSRAALEIERDRKRFNQACAWYQRIIDKQYGTWLKRNRIKA